MKARFWLLPISCLLLMGCIKLDERGFDNARLGEDIKNSLPVDIGAYTPFGWDRFYVYGPRSSRETIREEIGTSVPYPHKELETHCLLVFVSAGRVVTAFEEPRSVVDFINLVRPGGYSRMEAKFKGAVASDKAYLLSTN